MDIAPIIATGAVAAVSAAVGGLVPGLLKLRADSSARNAARLETLVDLAGELIEGCERWRSAAKDRPLAGRDSLATMEGIVKPRSELSRQRDQTRAQLHSLRARVAARDKALGEAAKALVDASAGSSASYELARGEFVSALSGLVR